MSSASRGLALREGLERLLVRVGRIRPRVEPRRGPQAGKFGDPIPRTPTIAHGPKACSDPASRRSQRGSAERRGPQQLAALVVMAHVTRTSRGLPGLELSAPRKPAW